MVTNAARLGQLARELRQAALDAEGKIPGGIELRDLPDQNWRRVQLGFGLGRLSAAVDLLAQTVAQHGSPLQLGEYVALMSTGVIVHGDLALVDVARAFGHDDFHGFICSLDSETPSERRAAARKAWFLRMARNKLLTHTDPDSLHVMDPTDAGGVILRGLPRSTVPSADYLMGIRALRTITGLEAGQDDDPATMTALVQALYANAESLDRGSRDRAAEAFSTVGFESPPIAQLVEHVVDLARTLAPAPTIVAPERRIPPHGTRIRSTVTPKGSYLAGRQNGRLIIAEYLVDNRG